MTTESKASDVYERLSRLVQNFLFKPCGLFIITLLCTGVAAGLIYGWAEALVAIRDLDRQSRGQPTPAISIFLAILFMVYSLVTSVLAFLAAVLAILAAIPTGMSWIVIVGNILNDCVCRKQNPAVTTDYQATDTSFI